VRPVADLTGGRTARLAERVHRHRLLLLRVLGLALGLYGATGLIGTIYGASLVNRAFVQARELVARAPDERARALRALDAISATLDDAAGASTNLSGSFDQGQVSLATSQQVATDVATSLRQAAAVASVQLFGLQPLAELGPPFSESADRLDDLARDLSRTGTAIGANSADARRIGSDFGRLRTEIETLRPLLTALPADPLAADSARQLELALSVMLVWIGLQSLIALVSGSALLLASFRHVPAP
jgi:hypothetical protein